jgi:hypothetical protein
MALLTDDCDLNENKLRTLFGGNGDYYIQVWTKDKEGLNQVEGVRIAMSGGNATPEIRKAVAALHWAMEEAGMNLHPTEDEMSVG